MLELNLAGAFNADARVGEVGGFSRARTRGATRVDRRSECGQRGNKVHVALIESPPVSVFTSV